MEYIIQPGDTLSGIASRFGVTLAAILNANPQITNPDQIIPGQRITIPTTRPTPGLEVYVVQPGDTLYRIARRFGLSLEQLLAANPQIINPSLIAVGQRINIPRPVSPPPVEGTVYTVLVGDTLFLIAQRFNTTVETLIRLNPGINPNLIFPGQRINVPFAPPPVAAPPGCVLFVSDRTGRLEVWRSNPDGTNQIQLTTPPKTPDQPVGNALWSPDGSRIAYLSGNQLFVVDNCGRNPRQLADNATDFSWSTAGTRLAYSNENGSFIVDLNENARILSGRLFSPVWFPGDQSLAGYTTVEGINYPVLATISAMGANFRIYDQNPVVPASKVLLSPDGRYAATFLFRGAPFELRSVVWIYDFSQNRLVQLPGQEFELGNGQNINLSFPGGWAPDSSRFVYSTILASNGSAEVRVANPQGEIIRQFTRGYYPEVSWGPTSDWIIYALSTAPGPGPLDVTRPRHVFIRNLRTGVERRVTDQGDNFDPDWTQRTCPVC